MSQSTKQDIPNHKYWAQRLKMENQVGLVLKKGRLRKNEAYGTK